MSKAMTKSQIVEHLAKKADIKKTQAASLLDELAKLACNEAKNSFTVPGLGKIVLVPRSSYRTQSTDRCCDKDTGQEGGQV